MELSPNGKGWWVWYDVVGNFDVLDISPSVTTNRPRTQFRLTSMEIYSFVVRRVER